jgi:hypothetical protein
MNSFGAGDVFIRPCGPEDTKYKKTPLGKVGWTPLSSRIRFVQDPIPCGRNIYDQRHKSSGTDSERSLGRRMQVMPRRDIEQDTFLNNEIGETIRYIKIHFGNNPLREAYDLALNTFMESDKRWKEYHEEEARLQSIFEGED